MSAPPRQCLLACRGKLLNVRDASTTQISGNTEIQNIKQIMGLQHGKVASHHLFFFLCIPISTATLTFFNPPHS